VVPVPVTADPAQIGWAPVVLLCVKSDDVRSAAQAVLPLLGTQGLLIALQNGIAHHPWLAELSHPSWVLGITAQGAHLLGPGQVRHGGTGPTFLGFPGKVSTSANHRLREVNDLMNRAGILTSIHQDILAAAWNKLIINAGINALTALENCTNGELLNRPAALATLKAAVLEGARVAKARGIAIGSDPVAMTIAVCRETRDNISSMLQDVRHGRRTEVEAINGAILREAQVLGIPAPANRVLLAGVKALEGVGVPGGVQAKNQLQ
jgi:2-dehydropantoate 2-reductase